MKKCLIVLGLMVTTGLLVSVAYACCGGPPPPTINATITQDELWPPDHKMVDIALNVETSSADGWQLLSVTSDEPDNAIGMGDGDTDNDIVIGPDSKSLQLRAERCGSRQTGRTYTIILWAWGPGGNATTMEQVFVPFSKEGGNQPQAAAKTEAKPKKP